jgi:outer membrane receptor protein involved in Fe transport
MVDGLDNNDATVGAVRATFSQEAIREFQVLTNSYSAEFGKAAGGVVNIVTRSGTNDLRGTVFGYYRDALNARDHFERFDPFGAPIEREKAPFGQIQWGGVLGGPIRKGRTFFFGSFERLKIDAHNFVNIDRHARDVLAANGFAVDLGHVPYQIGTTEVLGKIDHQFSPGSALVIRANVSDTTNENIEPFGGLVARSRGAALLRDDAALAASHTHVLGRWLNEARVQFARQDLTVESLDPACNGACDGDDEGGPTLELPGVASVGRQRFTPQARKNDRYQLMETLSYAGGRHSLKAGGEFNYLDNRLAALPLHFGGRFIFAALPANPALALSDPISAVEALERGLPAAYIQGYGNPQFAFGQSDVSAFLQDEWRIGRTLTVKPGVRYQKQLWPDSSYEVSTTGGGQLHYRIRQSGTMAPRLAAAWRPGGRRPDLDSRRLRPTTTTRSGERRDWPDCQRQFARMHPRPASSRIDRGLDVAGASALRTGVRISECGDRVSARLDGAICHAHGGGRRSRARARHRALGEFRSRPRPEPVGHDRLQPDRPRTRTGPAAQRHRRPRRHVGLRPSVHAVRRKLVRRPDCVAEQAARPSSVLRGVHAFEGRGHVHRLPVGVPPREQRRRP